MSRTFTDGLAATQWIGHNPPCRRPTGPYRRGRAPTAGSPARPADLGGTAWTRQTGPARDACPPCRWSADGAELVRFLETMPAAFCFLDRGLVLPARQRRGRAADGPAPRGPARAQSLWDVFPGLVGSVIEETYRAAVATGRPVTFETAAPRALPTSWFEIRVWPGPDGLAVYALDVTDRRTPRRPPAGPPPGTALLARVSAELSGELDTESALGRLARLVVPVLDRRLHRHRRRPGGPRPGRRLLARRPGAAAAAWSATPRVRLDAAAQSAPRSRRRCRRGDAGHRVGRRRPGPACRPGPARDLLAALGPGRPSCSR